MLESVIAGLLEHLRDVRLAVAALKGRLAHRPKGKDKWPSGPAIPFLRQIVNKVAAGLRLQRRIANQQCRVMPLQHGLEVGLLAAESGIDPDELAKINFHQRG